MTHGVDEVIIKPKNLRFPREQDKGEYGMNYHSFKCPCDSFRGTDFWMLNGDLTEEEIIKQLTEMKDKGVYSFIARTYLGLKSDYPGPNFKAKMRVIVETSKRLGLKIFVQAGYMPEAVLGLSEDHALRYIYPVKQGKEDGRPVLCRYGEWSFVEHNSGTFLDMFDPEAMDHYLKVSYEEMWAEFAEEYGKTILSVWVDEPSYSESYLPWTPKLETLFLERFGYSLADKVWMLYFDAEGCRTVRYQYRTLMRDLLEENYFKKVGAWCRANNLLFSGHLMMEETLQSQITRAQACMPYYRHFDIPGIDILKAEMNWADDPIRGLTPTARTFELYNTVKQCVSAAKQAGKKHILAEMYGVGGENFNFRNMTHIFDSYAVSGINHRSVHGIFYTLHGRGKRAYPPHISYYQPFWPKYKNITDYCARVSAFISEGRSPSSVAIVHPLETAYMLYHGSLKDAPGGGKELSRLDGYMYDLLTALRSKHCDADYIDLASVRDMASVENGALCVGEMRYRTVILPHLQVITAQLMALLEKFAAQGGKVVVCGDAPTMLDGVENTELAARFAAISCHADTLSQVLDQVDTCEYSFEGIGSENLFINHRVCESGEKFFVYNNDCAHEARIDFTTKCRGSLYLYDAYSGEIGAYPHKLGEKGLSAELTIPVGGSLLLSVEPPRDDVTAKIGRPTFETTLKMDGEWQAQPHGDNVLLLEYCRFRRGEGAFSEPLPIMAVQRLLSEEEYHGEVTLQFAFDAASDLDGLSLALEDPTEQQITLDGRVISNLPCGYYCDRSFEAVSVGSVSMGHHIIEIRRDFYPLTKVTNALTQLFETRHGVELEPMYLLGDFAVRGHRCVTDNGCIVFERDFTLTSRASTIATRGELTADGFPFYVGEMTLTCDVIVPETVDASRAKFRLEVMNAGCGEVTVNGIPVGDINRAPCELAVGTALKQGSNTVQIKLYSTLYNIIGPFHRPQGNVGNTFGGGYKNPDAAWLSIDTAVPEWEKYMSDFYPNWTDRYNVVPFGIRNAALVFEG